jgi:hypothetical protein
MLPVTYISSGALSEGCGVSTPHLTHFFVCFDLASLDAVVGVDRAASAGRDEDDDGIGRFTWSSEVLGVEALPGACLFAVSDGPLSQFQACPAAVVDAAAAFGAVTGIDLPRDASRAVAQRLLRCEPRDRHFAADLAGRSADADDAAARHQRLMQVVHAIAPQLIARDVMQLLTAPRIGLRDGRPYVSCRAAADVADVSAVQPKPKHRSHVWPPARTSRDVLSPLSALVQSP